MAKENNCSNNGMKKRLIFSDFDIEIIDKKSLLNQFQQSKDEMKAILQGKRVKFNLYVSVRFMRGPMVRTADFRNDAIISLGFDVDHVLEEAFEIINNRVDVWLSEGSGWVIDEIVQQKLYVAHYDPLSGNSFIETPGPFKGPRKGLVNIKNGDDKCFMWCHIASLIEVKTHVDRVTNYKPHTRLVNYEGIDFPVKITDIPKIESKNDIRFNIFGCEGKTVYPLYISKKVCDKTCEMLLVSDENKTHYIYIKDFDRLMFNTTKHSNSKNFCRYCLINFSTPEVLKTHTQTCLAINGKQAIQMPQKGSFITFKNYKNQLPAPFVIYADFECLTEKVSEVKTDKLEKIQSHVPCGFGYKVVCCYDQKYTKNTVIYRGADCVDVFLQDIKREVDECLKIKQTVVPMKNVDKELHANSHECHICGKLITGEDIKVRDHCHITGKYRGPAHSKCNLNYKINMKIPIIFHNLRGYDSHIIMQCIGKLGEDIFIIPNNMEKYMSFGLGKHIVFIDSFQFMSSSLAELVNNLEDYPIVKSEIDNHLIIKKGVYPYDYFDSWDRFNEDKLPPKSDFYSVLTGAGITDEDYLHAQTVWDTFGCKTLGDYHDLYLKTDVLLLADVFENFRRVCLEYYRLDPCHYFSSPGLSWDAMLKMTGIKLDLITDIDMSQFIEKGMRGGISYICTRYAKANNKYMQDYDPSKDSSYIAYLDANNLYGWAMCQKLPSGEFEWVDRMDNGEDGYILEVDLEYPKELHEDHNDYPLTPEKMSVTTEMLSEYCRNIHSITVKPPTKLIPNVRNKERYVLHYRLLQLYTNLGLKLTKIHRILKFKQSSWLSKYINFNTEKRAHSTNAFEKDFFKLMNNAIYGKTMENLRKRCNVKLYTDNESFKKAVTNLDYISSKKFIRYKLNSLSTNHRMLEWPS